MIEFKDYDILFPELVYDIVDYFRAGNDNKQPKEKSVWDYCQNSRFRGELPKNEPIQPSTVYEICENLVKKKFLNRLRDGGMLGMNANYIYLPDNTELFVMKQPEFVFRLNCLAYGFRFIYNAYRRYVMPIVVTKNGDVSANVNVRITA